MSNHTKILIAFFCIFLASVLIVRPQTATGNQSSASTGVEAIWLSRSFRAVETTPTERRQIARALPLVPEAGVRVLAPNDIFSDPNDDLLFKWLSPDDADYGLTVNGSTMTMLIPDGPLGFPTSFYWSAVTFDPYDLNLAAFDWVPDFGSIWWDGTPTNYTDGLNSSIPSFADLRQINLTRVGDEAEWQLTSEGVLPGLPDAHQLGYNIFMEAGYDEIVQFVGATAFTPAGWQWAIRDRGDLFPGWDDNLDVTQVVVDQPSDPEVRFEAAVAGFLLPSYGESATWPHFYWYLDSDNNRETGDDFTYSYQEGSYVFIYELKGIEAVVQAFYDDTTGQWLGVLRKKVAPDQWETVATATPYFASNRVGVIFDRADTGIHSTFRWGLLTWFQMARGGSLYSGNVDVAPNSGMQTQTLVVDPDQALAEKYAPVLYRASSEVYYPVSIDYTLRKSDLLDDSGQRISSSPSIADLVAHAMDESRLDLDGKKPSESQQSWQGDSNRTPTIYARVFHAGNTTVIQYWFHYYYSSWGYTKGCDRPGIICIPFGGNNHEGDWEMIQIVLQNDIPTHAVYAQHFGGSKRLWDYVEKQRDHPAVYVGWGSHASFFKDAYYHQHGFWAETTGQAETPTLDVRLLPSSSDPPWLQFRGVWGVDTGSPRGPRWSSATEPRDKWDDPVDWYQDAKWDEEENYGGCETGSVDPDRSHNWRVCVSGLLRRWWKPVLYDSDDNVLIGPDINNIDPRGQKAEYLLNCENGGKQSIILYKADVPATGKVVFEPTGDLCNTSAAHSSLAAYSSLSITLALPDLVDEEILLADFHGVIFTDTTAGQIRLGTDNPQLELDHNNDGTFDEIVEPDGLIHQPADFTPPATTSDLTVVEAGASIELRWTAPGNDGKKGTAANYDVRYAEFPVTEETWDYAAPIPHGLAPSEAGTTERLSLDLVPPGRYFFGLRTFDQDYNVSGVSNTVEGRVQVGVFLPIILR